jgi:hypothetical protein
VQLKAEILVLERRLEESYGRGEREIEGGEEGKEVRERLRESEKLLDMQIGK